MSACTLEIRVDRTIRDVSDSVGVRADIRRRFSVRSIPASQWSFAKNDWRTREIWIRLARRSFRVNRGRRDRFLAV